MISDICCRFSRNTTECLELVRKLQKLDVPIYFEKENINKGSMESELFLTILSFMTEVLKRIYREYREGYSMDKIAAVLEADGILTGARKPRWLTNTINSNEKYIGDELLQKTYTTNFFNKTRPASFRSITLKATMKRLFLGRFTCECRKNWYAGE